MRSWKEERGITYLLVIAIALTILDLYTTFIGLQRGLIEGNPIMYHILTNYGWIGFFLVNTALSVLMVGFLTWTSIEKLKGIMKYPPIGVYCVIRGYFVVNNILLLMS